MIGQVISGCIKDIIVALSANKRYLYNPTDLYKIGGMDAQAKVKFKRNLQLLNSNNRIKNLLKQLEKEINNSMNK